jgi:3-hydroxy-9,10-secoandrosta-1,3,5(10)-triene-9,17-dione monooxygenase reductase component
MSADAQAFKNVMSRWATGISVVTTHLNDEWQGFTVNSFASVSIEPLLISLSIAKGLHAGELLQQSRVFTVNILTDSQAEFGMLFAGMLPERNENRFAGIATTVTKAGNALLPDTLGWMDCRVHQEIDVGASTLILGEVTDAGWADGAEPLVYYHRQWGRFAPFPI